MVTFKNLGRYGRIGNQMFEIASTIGIATKCRLGYGFPKWMNYDQLERFGGGEDIDIQRWFANPLPKLIEANYTDRHIKWGYHDVTVPDWTNLNGHMQSERYFAHCSDLIRYYFEFANKTQPMRNTVAVHFRGGDYGDDYHPHCTPDYYRKALDLIGTNKTILVFSDSPDLALSVIGRGEAIRGNHSMVDLELMSQCDHHIIANSTFSWWGAWLANSKQVIAPKRWFGPNASQLTTKDMYPSNWSVL